MDYVTINGKKYYGGKDERNGAIATAGLGATAYGANKALGSHLRKSIEMRHGLSREQAKKLDGKTLKSHYKMLDVANSNHAANKRAGKASTGQLTESARTYKKARLLKGLGTVAKGGALTALGYTAYGLAKKNNVI
jgi:hypothetical protein